MIGALQLKYNRGRQATITSELVDIITGASGKFPLYYLSFYCYLHGSLAL